MAAKSQGKPSMRPSIGTVISYCTNDYRFVGKCIEEAKKFSKQIMIPVCDHFFDGKPENRQLLERTYSEHLDCQFVEFPYLPNRLYSRYHSLTPKDKDWSMFWGTTARYIGFHYLNPEIERVFFLDSDEIVEGEAFLAWLDQKEYLNYEAMRLAAYLYALRPTLRAKKVVNLPLFVKKSTFAPLTLLNGLDRIGAYLVHLGTKREEVVGLNGRPFVHHYSWVRTREECEQKTRTWGHRHDENWPDIIEKTFEGKQIFDLDREFEEIENPYFDPFEEKIPTKNHSENPFPHVLVMKEEDLFRKELEILEACLNEM